MKYTLNITKTDEDSFLSALVGSASTQIAAWCRRVDRDGNDAFQLKSRTEYLDPKLSQRRYYPRAYPVQSVTSVYGDSTGLYAGDETLIASTEYILDSDLRSLVFRTTPFTQHAGYLPMPKGLRLIYVAGLAADPVVSTWVKSADTGGTLAVGKYVRGEDSTAVGYIRARGATSISIECLAGVFLEGEQITEYERVDASRMDSGLQQKTAVTATLTTCSARSLVEAHPALVLACERHIAHWRKNRDNFDDLTVSQDGATRFSRSDMKNQYEFLPEIKALLSPYRNLMVA